MRRIAWRRWASLVSLVALTGCSNNPMVLQGRVDGLQQQQLALSRQNQELQSRAGTLDRDNQGLETLLAQSQQRGKVLADENSLLRDQLSGMTSQYAQLREEKETSEQKAQTLAASMRRQGGVSISPNSSLPQTLPSINLPGVMVRRDGDVVRVELPGDRLFDYGAAQLRPDAVQSIATVAAELARMYPNQMIGVEGHTDSDPAYRGQWRSNHQLSASQAMAVHDLLLTQTALRAEQLFVVGHGPNHPLVSNASFAGKQRNRRVELVVYPDTNR